MQGRDIVIHVGRQKTGTTSIQRFMAAHSETIAEHDILYPETGRNDGEQTAHHQLAVALNPRESDGHDLAELKKKLDREVLKHPTSLVVLSSEAFQRISDFSRLETFFADCKPRALCYLRECMAAKQSSWAQSVHATRQTSDFVSYALRHHHRYEKMTERWKLFSSQLELALFDRQQLHHQDVVADFLWRIGHPSLAEQSVSLARDAGTPSLGGNLLHIKRIVNIARSHLPNMRGEYRAFAELAAAEKRWRGRWHVSPKDVAAIQRVDRADREFLNKTFEEVRVADLNDAPPMPDAATLKEDIRTTLQIPVLSGAFDELGLKLVD
ncbi:MAG: hypothetical protein V3U76_20420 [Granulosicoccus sp.]